MAGAAAVRGTQLAALLAVHDRHKRLVARARAEKAARAAGWHRQRGRSARATRRAAGRVGEPYPDELLRYENKEGVELAYVAALQLLPPNQRAALLLRDVLGFSARETAEALETSIASVNSALQRARAKLERERPARSQQATLRALGDERARELVARFVDAWNRADVAAIVAMLSEDASFSMPPLPTWFRGRDAIAAFMSGRIFRSAWRFEVTSAGGQPAMLGRRRDLGSGRYVLRALTVLTFDGQRITAMTAFLGPGVLARHRRPTDDSGP